MFISEFKNNIKGLILWVIAIGFIVTLFVVLYPVAIEKMSNLDEMLLSFPKELIKAFNLENYDWSNVLNYFAYEYQYINIASLIFAAMLGANLLAKEEINKTIQFVYSKPITRTKIFLNKMYVALTYILIYNVGIYVVTSVSLLLFIKDQNIDYILLGKVYLGQFIVQILFIFIGLFMATIFKKPRGAASISAFMVLFSYVLGLVSKLTENLNFLKYFSPTEYMVASNIIKNNGYEIKYIFIVVLVSFALFFISINKYKTKEYVI
ncbi:MAG: ABC transporter permease [Clostridia bacterium]|nr:ABC transporter permease [Clostridia bacterium]